VRRIIKGDIEDNNQDKLMIRLEALQDDVSNHKEEYDFIMNMKSALKRREEEVLRYLHYTHDYVEIYTSDYCTVEIITIIVLTHLIILVNLTSCINVV
jgi:hypothetical protein